MNDRLRNVQSLMAALGHSSRFRLTLSLLEGERCVGDLARAIGLSQSCTTRHVQALERAGIVRSRREGKRVLVGIESDREGIAQLLEWLAPAADAERAAGGPPPRPASSRAGRRDPGPRASAPRAGPGADPDVPRAESEEPAPLATPASGTHAPPEPEPTPHPRRTHETLEDFLL